ncbi:S8 family serine peptidase [Streptomyces sp. NPDC056468]|uniref:S8 family serine peptidase n=1 Tax=Streptomyces sp. NPDC056468 TaxID=3345830 RepID=UPI0036BE3320
MLAVAVAVPVTCVPAFAAHSGRSAASGDDDPGATLLPPLPVRLGEGNPCTGPSDETATGVTWSQTALGLPRAQRISRGSGATVGVVDTGVAPDVPSLSGRVTALDGADEDCVGHGTFAAGLIAAAPEKGSGIAGVAPAAEIVALRGTDDRGVPSVEKVAEGIRTAADRGAQVIYVGYVLRTGRTELTAAVAHATERDALVVAPAAPDAVPKEELGPDNKMPEGPYWPAAVPEVLSVVDFGPSGVRQKNAPPAYEPDLSAPGSSMVSAGPQGSGHYIGSGASLAAAGVAGTAALVRAYQPDATAAEVTRRLLDTAYPADTPRADPFAALSVVSDKSEAAPAKPVPAHLPQPADPGPRTRSLVIAAAGLTLVLLVGGMAAVIPRGRARGWVPPGRSADDASAAPDGQR